MTCRCFCSNTFNDITYCPLHKAAPDLLAALERIVTEADDPDNELEAIDWEHIRAIIAKAKEGL